MKTTDFAYYLTRYFTTFLAGQRNVSENTIKSYRDTFKLFLLYCTEVEHLHVNKLTLAKITRELIIGFLDWLESERNNTIATRNHRLTSIHAFYRYLQIENPINLAEYNRIISIKSKNCPKKTVGFLLPSDMKLLFDAIDTQTKWGRRDLVLLSTLYDTGARVQELCDLTPNNIRISRPATAMLKGKGSKSRHVPLMNNTSDHLEKYMVENRLLQDGLRDMPLFFNRQRQKLTRAGIAHVISKYTYKLQGVSPTFPRNVNPHMFRHSKAMHLYQAGIDLIYIRDILGHVDMSTTEIYARLDIEQKRKVLETVYPDITSQNLPDWSEEKDLMAMLNSL